MRLTGLISPESPTSPAKQKPSAMAMSSFEDKIAATTAKSIAVSSTEIPPVTFQENVFCSQSKPARFLKLLKSCSNVWHCNLVLRCGVP